MIQIPLSQAPMSLVPLDHLLESRKNTLPLYGVLLQAASFLLAHSGSTGWLCAEPAVPVGLYLTVTVMDGISLFLVSKRRGSD